MLPERLSQTARFRSTSSERRSSASMVFHSPRASLRRPSQ
jgi:hypothetical protein